LCRKTDAGVMCPSYMATRASRTPPGVGRNALVKALSAADPRTALGEDGLHEVLDLCLMCKACKSECPLSVDMATLKAEALHQAHQNTARRCAPGVRRHPRTEPAGLGTAPLSNLPARLPLARRLLGLAPNRPLPVFTRATLPAWFRRRSGPVSGEWSYENHSPLTTSDLAC